MRTLGKPLFENRLLYLGTACLLARMVCAFLTHFGNIKNRWCFDACSHRWKNTDPNLASIVTASIRKEKIGSEKSATRCPFDRGRLVKSYLFNDQIDWRFEKGASL